MPTLKSWQRPQVRKAEDTDPSPTSQPPLDEKSSKIPLTQRGFNLPITVSNEIASGSGPSLPVPHFADLGGQGSTQSSCIPEEELMGGSETSPAFSNHHVRSGDSDYDHLSQTGNVNGSYMSSVSSVPGSMSGAQRDPKSPVFPTSPSQKRDLNKVMEAAPGGDLGVLPFGPSSDSNKRVNIFPVQDRTGSTVSALSTIPHTGSAYYLLTAAAAATGSPFGISDADTPETEGKSSAEPQGAGQQGGPLSELADVVGQLSLDDNREVRYHGRTSGLYLVSKSARYRDFFWRFPQICMVPSASDASGFQRTEGGTLGRPNALDLLPDKHTSDHLMELYWTYVHPHIPLLYRSLFVRQYRNTVHGTGSAAATAAGDKAPAQAVGGTVPVVLLLAVYSVAARYSHIGGQRRQGSICTAGDEYAAKAKELLLEDLGSSRVTTVQTLLLLAYRGNGLGAMAESWTHVGMAVRMAQDLGLFRDVDKWFLPVNAFGYEEKQTRKRVWWTAIVLDKVDIRFILWTESRS